MQPASTRRRRRRDVTCQGEAAKAARREGSMTGSPGLLLTETLGRRKKSCRKPTIHILVQTFDKHLKKAFCSAKR